MSRYIDPKQFNDTTAWVVYNKATSDRIPNLRATADFHGWRAEQRFKARRASSSRAGAVLKPVASRSVDAGRSPLGWDWGWMGEVAMWFVPPAILVYFIARWIWA